MSSVEAFFFAPRSASRAALAKSKIAVAKMHWSTRTASPAAPAQFLARLACAACLGTGLTDGEPCRLCGGRTVHTCENCKGRGRFIPTMLDARVSRDPETELEEIGLQ